MEKTNKTFKEKYGCTFGGQYAGNEELRRKQRESLKSHFGEDVENPSQAQAVKDKKVKTCTEHYGGYGYGSEELRRRAEATYEEKTGYKNARQNPKVKEKTKKTNLKKYGTAFPANAKQWDPYRKVWLCKS